MECDQIPAPLLWDEAGPEALQKYCLHAQFCEACRARVLREAPDQLLFDVQRPTLPDDFWFGFWQSIEKKISTPISKSARPGITKWIRWTAVFLFGLLIVLYGRDLPEERQVSIKKIEAYPLIEDLENPGARYYIFQTRDAEKIVMVFDPSVDL
jgi:hypothetical protein